jgi:hypothetical protein
MLHYVWLSAFDDVMYPAGDHMEIVASYIEISSGIFVLSITLSSAASCITTHSLRYLLNMMDHTRQSVRDAVCRSEDHVSAVVSPKQHVFAHHLCCHRCPNPGSIGIIVPSPS